MALPMFTEEQRERAMEVLRKSFPQRGPIISFSHWGGLSDRYQYQKDVKEVIANNAVRLLRTSEKRVGLADFVRLNGKVLGLTMTEYRARGGKIIYCEVDTIGGYLASAELSGFDEQSEAYKNLRSQLEELSGQGVRPQVSK